MPEPIYTSLDTDSPSSLDQLERSPAVRLFVDRASAVHPHFTVASENASAVSQICRRLDGIPLALELAAAMLAALTAEQLTARIDQCLRTLTGGNRAANPRQQTLRATIDWSYLLLTETERRVFERLSVFANGWMLEAGEIVCAGDTVPSEHVSSALLQLIRKSLVLRSEGRQGKVRYGLLETLREYAFDKLRERGADLAATRQRHANFYSILVQRLDPAAPTTLLAFSGESRTTPVFETLEDACSSVLEPLVRALADETASGGRQPESSASLAMHMR